MFTWMSLTCTSTKRILQLPPSLRCTCTYIVCSICICIYMYSPYIHGHACTCIHECHLLLQKGYYNFLPHLDTGTCTCTYIHVYVYLDWCLYMYMYFYMTNKITSSKRIWQLPPSTILQALCNLAYNTTLGILSVCLWDLTRLKQYCLQLHTL